MNHKTTKILSLLSFLGAPLISHGDVLFSETFESYTTGQNLDVPGTQWSASDQPDLFLVKDDTNDYFSSDPNLYGQLSTTNLEDGNLFVTSNSFSGTQTGQISFEFYDPSSETHTGAGWILRIGENNGNGNTSFSLFIMDGELVLGINDFVNAGSTITTYDKDTANSLDIIFNNSNTSLAYAGGNVASQRMDVFLNGVLVGDDLTGSGGADDFANIANINFTAKDKTDDPFTGTLYVDNFEVNDQVAIPEVKSSSMLIGVSMLLFVCMGHRRKVREA